ncbi:hypothetical protein CYJ59_01340 [Gardnerella leopoldii]|uniref:Uncharacterized protein n=1 Tax=Gardnerella leopoldii TaxID=2792978 RepID=A0ABX4SGB6_9BIFI|nr:hypothetical protein CYJ60_01340 [Gardnerella vaginalis]PKZ19117.1 hypothetical protein CYJ59_01340 [Gardnerella vaginalis]RFT32092.1 hypothetical protein CG404_00885 [Bifidobacteriaceae bacterium VN003]
MGSLKVLDGEWEKRFEGPLRETQQSASISPSGDYLQMYILYKAATNYKTNRKTNRKTSRVHNC